jgi:hypothetical protein
LVTLQSLADPQKDCPHFTDAAKFVTIQCNGASFCGIHQIVIKLKFNEPIIKLSLYNCLRQIPYLRMDATN